MTSFTIKSNDTLFIEITERFSDRDLNSIFLFLESLIDDYSNTKVYLTIGSNVKKEVNQELKNNRFLKPYQIVYISRKSQKIAS